MVKLVKTHVSSTYGTSYNVLVNGITAGKVQSHWSIWLAFNNNGEKIKPAGMAGYNTRRQAVKAVADYYDENPGFVAEWTKIIKNMKNKNDPS